MGCLVLSECFMMVGDCRSSLYLPDFLSVCPVSERGVLKSSVTMHSFISPWSSVSVFPVAFVALLLGA